MQASKGDLSSIAGQGKCKGNIAPDVCGASVDSRSASQLDDVSQKVMGSALACFCQPMKAVLNATFSKIYSVQ